jgi:pseudaminic acid cytidylyltransferase
MAQSVAVIPARAGSKRTPRKNVRQFCGRPIIAYSIETALGSGLFDRVVVSTDSDEIAQIASTLGAEIPFMRPATLSDDHTTTAAVLAHALETLCGDAEIDIACCIYATAPFLAADHLAQGHALIQANEVASVVSVTSFAAPILRAFTVTADGRLKMMWPEYRDTRSNDLPEALHDAGMFYWVRAERFRRDPVLFSDDTLPVRIPRYLVHDIDTPEDWDRAELVYAALYGRGG